MMIISSPRRFVFYLRCVTLVATPVEKSENLQGDNMGRFLGKIPGSQLGCFPEFNEHLNHDNRRTIYQVQNGSQHQNQNHQQRVNAVYKSATQPLAIIKQDSDRVISCANKKCYRRTLENPGVRYFSEERTHPFSSIFRTLSSSRLVNSGYVTLQKENVLINFSDYQEKTSFLEPNFTLPHACS